MCQNGKKWSKLPKMVKIAKNGLKSSKMVQNIIKCPKLSKTVQMVKNDQNGPKWSKLPKIVKNCQNCLKSSKMVKKGQKLTKMAGTAYRPERPKADFKRPEGPPARSRGPEGP